MDYTLGELSTSTASTSSSSDFDATILAITSYYTCHANVGLEKEQVKQFKLPSANVSAMFNERY